MIALQHVCCILNIFNKYTYQPDDGISDITVISKELRQYKHDFDPAIMNNTDAKS